MKQTPNFEHPTSTARPCTDGATQGGVSSAPVLAPSLPGGPG